MVTVRITETYDLSSKLDSMGVIGIHTPTASEITKVWGNMFNAHSHYKIKSMDCVMACASMLPADPLQIGSDAGQIAPSDMFNPILFTAVSNEGFNSIINKIFSGSSVGNNANMSAVIKNVGGSGSSYTAFDVYYALLAEPDRYRKAMPQAGMSMKHVVPIVYPLYGTYGNGLTPGSDGQVGKAPGDSAMSRAPGDEGTYVANAVGWFRGRPVPMPAIPTRGIYASSASTAGSQVNLSYPSTYVACIIVPPAKQNLMYFRLSITWNLEFFGIRSDLEDKNTLNLGIAGKSFYSTDYGEQSKNFEQKTDSVDVSGIDIEPIMLSGA